MEFWTAIGVLARRWRIVLAGLAATALVGVPLVLAVRPRYDLTGSLVLLKGTEPPSGLAGGNPWQTADYTATQFAVLMADAVTGPEFRRRAQARGVGEGFVVTTSTNQTPVLWLTVREASAEVAVSSYDALRDEVRSELRARQAEVRAPEDTWYAAVDLAAPTVPEAHTGSRTMVALLVAVLGLSLTAGVALGADRLTGVVALVRSRTGDDPPAVPAGEGGEGQARHDAGPAGPAGDTEDDAADAGAVTTAH